MLLVGHLRQREWETEHGEKRHAFEVDVTEIGPSLKWATVTVAKATRTTGSGDQRWATAQATAPAAPAAASGTPPLPDEPPF